MNRKPLLIDLVIIGTRNRLKADNAQNYLGAIWWLLEPCLVMLVYYAVFGLLLQLRSPDFTAILLVGVMTWQWISRCISSGTNSLLTNPGIISTYNVNYMLFPLISLATETTRSICVFFVLMLLLVMLGTEPTLKWLWYPLVLVCALLVIVGITLCLALLLPFIPDTLYIINVALMALMFGSGIFYSLDNIPETLHQYFLLNPIATIIHEARTVLIHGENPSFLRLSCLAGFGTLFIVIANYLHRKLEHHYFHLAVAQ